MNSNLKEVFQSRGKSGKTVRGFGPSQKKLVRLYRWPVSSSVLSRPLLHLFHFAEEPDLDEFGHVFKGGSGILTNM